MPMELDIVRGMLIGAQKAVKEMRLLLQENKIEEARETAARKILCLVDMYKEGELEKYRNTPDNLKSAPNSERMLENAERMEAVLDLFRNENDDWRPCEEWNLDAVDQLLEEIINS